MNWNRKRTYVVLGSTLVLAGAAATFVIGGQGAPAAASSTAAPAAATEVDVADVIERSIVEAQDFSGQIEAIDDVDVRPLVSGAIVGVHFKDAALVAKGARLFTIDPRPYKAAFDVAAAQVAAAQSRAGYASTDAARAERLLADNAIAKRDYDQVQNASREARANLQAAQAQLETARVNLGYTQILAPVAGRASHAELTVGNVVSAGAGAPVLTKIVSVSPIYASFEVDEQTYLKVLSREGKASIPVRIGLADEPGFSRQGLIDSVDNRLSAGSGTIRVRARINNPDGRLVPGLYARIEIAGGSPHAALLIADTAIGTDQDKKFVMVVDRADRVQRREVTLGGLHEGLRIIQAGLRPGERVIVDGVQRVAANDRVKPHMTAMPRAWRQAALLLTPRA
uniref:Efflux transporter, RND family, MFP subunit n=1 Tax=Caulobacter sp. (strain K31) TaxID=366602 RepID=B0T966_CAUSK